MIPVAWKCWYANGDTFSSQMATVSALPSKGVVVIMVYYDEEFAPGFPYREILQGWERYVFVPPTSSVPTSPTVPYKNHWYGVGDQPQTTPSNSEIQAIYGADCAIRTGGAVTSNTYDLMVTAAINDYIGARVG
jgi:hypothetical protein